MWANTLIKKRDPDCSVSEATRDIHTGAVQIEVVKSYGDCACCGQLVSRVYKGKGKTWEEAVEDVLSIIKVAETYYKGA